MSWRGSLKVRVNAALIGPLGIATNTGELFVEWRLSVKKRSPFPHTAVSELTNEWIGYEPTSQAFQHEGTRRRWSCYRSCGRMAAQEQFISFCFRGRSDYSARRWCE